MVRLSLLAAVAIASVPLVSAIPAIAERGRPAGCAAEPTPEFLEAVAEIAAIEEVERAALDAGNVTAIRQAASISVPVWMHVVSTSSTTAGGNVPESQLNAQLRVMNEDYNPYGISFTLAGITRTVNTAWSTDSTSGAKLAMRRALRKGDYKTLNLYFMTRLEEDSLGYCYFPTTAATGSTAFIQDGCSNRFDTVPGGALAPFNLGKTVVHEVGHWFGLLHTFQGGCTGTGDQIADTPAQASFSSGCPVGRDSCPNQAGSDPITNYMDYSDDSCYEEFTPNQKTRMVDMYNRYRA